jgi:hypothetical protein
VLSGRTVVLVAWRSLGEKFRVHPSSERHLPGTCELLKLSIVRASPSGLIRSGWNITRSPGLTA